MDRDDFFMKQRDFSQFFGNVFLRRVEIRQAVVTGTRSLLFSDVAVCPPFFCLDIFFIKSCGFIKTILELILQVCLSHLELIACNNASTLCENESLQRDCIWGGIKTVRLKRNFCGISRLVMK